VVPRTPSALTEIKGSVLATISSAIFEVGSPLVSARADMVFNATMRVLLGPYASSNHHVDTVSPARPDGRTVSRTWGPCLGTKRSRDKLAKWLSLKRDIRQILTIYTSKM
jgi:hypothetical protein